MKKSSSARPNTNNLIHGRRSKLVQDFLEKHNLQNLELPSTGSIGKDMVIKLAAYQEKMEAMRLAMDILRSQDARALGLFSMLTEINMMLSKFEQEALEKGIELINHPNYYKWQTMKLDILKHYDRIKFDLTKLQAESAMHSKREDDVLYVTE